MMIRVFTLLCLLLVAGCAKAPLTPDWIAGEPAAYSGERYLLGRGQADSIGLARDRARADLAKIFAVQIREQSSDQLLWEQGGEGWQGLQASVSRDIQARTSQLLEGVQIAETWQSETGGDYHALAVLDRLQAGNRFRQKIHQFDSETAESIQRARQANGLPQQVAAARQALLAQIKRQHEQQLLTIVDRTGTGIKAKYQLAELKNDLDQLLDRWEVTPQVTVDDLGGLLDLLSGALGNAGLLHRETVEEADYLLTGELVTEDLKTADGWYWLRGILTISLLERKSGRVLGTHQWPLKTSSRQAEMVEIRVQNQLVELLNRELLEVLIDFGSAGEVNP
jgi:LPP20 lipoprotein